MSGLKLTFFAFKAPANAPHHFDEGEISVLVCRRGRGGEKMRGRGRRKNKRKGGGFYCIDHPRHSSNLVHVLLIIIDGDAFSGLLDPLGHLLIELVEFQERRQTNVKGGHKFVGDHVVLNATCGQRSLI